VEINIRVYQFAHERRVDFRIVMQIAERLGLYIGSPVSTLEPQTQAAIERVLDNPDDPPPEVSGAPVPRPGSPPTKTAKQALPLPPSDPS
jgi:hypothetical protein